MIFDFKLKISYHLGTCMYFFHNIQKHVYRFQVNFFSPILLSLYENVANVFFLSFPFNYIDSKRGVYLLFSTVDNKMFFLSVMYPNIIHCNFYYYCHHSQ